MSYLCTIEKKTFECQQQVCLANSTSSERHLVADGPDPSVHVSLNPQGNIWRITFNCEPTIEQFESLKRLTSLICVRIDKFIDSEHFERSILGEKLLEQLMHLKNLRSVVISNYRLEPGVVEQVCSIQTLQWLGLHNVDLTDTDCRSIARLKDSLLFLYLSGCSLEDDAIEPLSQLTILRKCQLRNTSVTTLVETRLRPPFRIVPSSCLNAKRMKPCCMRVTKKGTLYLLAVWVDFAMLQVEDRTAQH